MTPDNLTRLFNADSHGMVANWAIPTGSFWLDSMLGGGWPGNKVSEILGYAGAGASTLALMALAQCPGPNLFIDTGNSFKPEYAKTLGVDLDSLGYATNIDHGLAAAEALCPELLVIDGPRIPTALLPDNQTVLYLPTAYPDDEEAVARVRCRTGKIFEGGQQMKIDVLKSPALPCRRTGSLQLHYGKGVYRAEELFDLGLKNALISRQGSQYYLGSELLGKGRKASLRAVQDRTGVSERLERDLATSRILH